MNGEADRAFLRQLGQFIKRSREAAGLTQVALAGTGNGKVDVSTVTKLERGVEGYPRPLTVRKLAQRLSSHLTSDCRKSFLNAVDQAVRSSDSAQLATAEALLAGGEDSSKSRPGSTPIMTAARTESTFSTQLMPARREDARVLRRRTEIVEMAITLIGCASELSKAHSGEISVTFVGRRDLFDTVPGAWDRWRGVLAAALERGWDVIHLVRGVQSKQSSLTLVTAMLDLLGGSGDYVPRYASQDYRAVAPGYNLLVVPGQGALLLLSTEHYGQLDVGFYYPPGGYADVLQSHFEMLCVRSEPLLKAHPVDSPAFGDAQASVEGLDGERCVVLDGLSEVTVPDGTHEVRASKLLAAGGEAARGVSREITNRRRRREMFLEYLRRGSPARDICSKRALIRLVEQGVYSPDDLIMLRGGSPETPDQRIAHLQAIIALLEEFENYELAIVDDEFMDKCRAYWLAKGGEKGRVFMEVSVDIWNSDMVESGIEVVEPAFVEAFCSYFQDFLWASIPLQDKERRRVIGVLQELIVLAGKVSF